MAVSTLNFAGRCGAVLISLSLIWMAAASADQLLAGESDNGEDSSRLSQFVHNQSFALSALYVDLALAQAGQIGEPRSSNSKRRSVKHQARALDQFLAKGDASRDSASAQGGVKTPGARPHNAKRHRGLAAFGDAVAEVDVDLDLNACAAACACGKDGIACGDIRLADSMTLVALDKVRKFSARQIAVVLPALANIDDLLAARYFACDFPRHLAALTRDQSGFAPAQLLAAAPNAVPAFNWQTTSISPPLSASDHGFEMPTAVEQRHEQRRVAADARQLAWLYKMAGQNAKAELWLRRVIPFYVDHLAEDPRALHDVYYELGELRLFQDDQGDAWEFYRQALAISALYPGVIPDPAWLLDRLAQTCVHLGKTDDSERFSRLALAATCPPGRSVSAELKGLSLKDVLSLPTFKNVLNSESSNKVRGLLQTMIDQYWQAEQYANVRLILEFLLGKAAADPHPLAIEKVAVSADTRKSLEEKNRMAMVQLGYLHLYDGDFQAGIDCFNHVLTAKQITVREKADYYAVLGQLADDLGAQTEAEKDFRRAIHLYKIYCRNPRLEFEDREWVTDYIETLAWQNQIKKRVGQKNDYLKALDLHRWPQSPIKVFVAVEGDTGFNQETSAKLYAIFETWTAATHGLVTCVRVPDYESADVTVERAGDHSVVASGSGGRTTYEYRFARPGESGQAVDWQPNNNKTVPPPMIVTKAHITLLCRLPDASQLGPAGAERLYSLTLHEAGHALGLDGHSPYGKDIMYWKSAQTGLSDRDIASLSHLYARRE